MTVYDPPKLYIRYLPHTPGPMRNFGELRQREWRRISLLKLSDKYRGYPKRGLIWHPSGTVRPALAELYRPNPYPERFSSPYSDSLKATFGNHIF
jgi:hypothetical protein